MDGAVPECLEAEAHSWRTTGASRGGAGGRGGSPRRGAHGHTHLRQAPAPKAPAIPSSLSLAPCPSLPLPSDSSRWPREHVSGTRRGPKGGLRSGGRENAALGTRTRGPGTGTSSAVRGRERPSEPPRGGLFRGRSACAVLLALPPSSRVPCAPFPPAASHPSPPKLPGVQGRPQPPGVFGRRGHS